MRKLKLLMAALLPLLGIIPSFADGYADYLTTDNGWTLIASTSDISTDGSCVYVIASEDENTTVVGIPGEGSTGQATYQTINGQPKRQQVWKLSINSQGGYALENLAHAGYYLHASSGAWDMVSNSTEQNIEKTSYIFSFDGSGNLNIQTNNSVNSDGSYNWGLWDGDKVYGNGEKLAGNKDSDNAGTFKLYKKILFSGIQDVTFLLGNPDFEGSYTSIFDGSNRHVYQPEGWTTTRINGGNENDMTILESTDEAANNFSAYTINETTGRGNKTYWTRVHWGSNVGINLTQSVTLPAGAYYLTVDVNNYSGNTNNNVHIKMGTKDLTTTRNGNKNDSNWKNYRVAFLSDGTAMNLQFIINHVTNKTEQIVGVDNFKLYSVASGANMTTFVTNPNFDSNITGWTAPSGGEKLADNKQDQTRNFYETWNSNPKQGRMYQTIENLPQGTYKLRVMAFADQTGTMNPANTDVAVYAQGQEVGTTTSTHIHRNFVNSTDFTYYETFAYVDATGKIEIGMRQDVASFRWLGMDNVTLTYLTSENQEDELLLAELQSKWTAVKTACNLLSDDNYTNVKGAERANLTNDLNASISTIDDYKTEAAKLESSYKAFIAGKTNWDMLVAEIAKAAILGISTTAAETIRDAANTTADNALQAVKDLKVSEYEYVKDNYSYGVSLGSWNTTGPTGSLTEQHWSGKTHEYLEQSSDAYDQSSWTIKYDQDLNLPAGNYIFKVAGRQANSNTVTLSLTVTDKTIVPNTCLGSVSDFPKGDTGLGITVNGATCYSTANDSTFANSNKGRGWEWRFVKFTLASPSTVNVSVDAVATSSKMWVSFCDATVLTDNEANIDLIEYNIDVASATTTYNNATYANVTGSEKTALKNCIDADPGTTSESIAAAKLALDNAVAAFTAAKDNYDALVAFNSTVAGLAALPFADSDKKPSAYTITSSTTSEGTVAAIASMTTAIRAYYESNALAEGVIGSTNYTSSIKEATCAATAVGEEHGTYDNGTWTCNYVRIQTGGGYTDAAGATKEFYFDSNGQFWNANQGEASLEQSVSNLPAGKYLLTVTARASSGATLTLTANGKSVNPASGMTPGYFGNGWDDTSLLFTVGNAGTATIKFSGKNGGSTNKYFSVDRFRLVRIGNLDDVAINESSETAPVATTDFVNVSTTRTLSADYWNTFAVPFSTDIPTGWSMKELDNEDGETMTFKDATTIEAGKPYLVKPTSDAVNPTFDGVAITATTGVTVGTTLTFTGLLYQKNYDALGTQPAYLATDGTVKKLTSGTMKGMRAYFNVPKSGDSKLNIVIDGVSLGIDQIDGGQLSNGNAKVYNLNGQQVKAPRRGIYILNGKKVVVK